MLIQIDRKIFEVIFIVWKITRHLIICFIDNMFLRLFRGSNFYDALCSNILPCFFLDVGILPRV